MTNYRLISSVTPAARDDIRSVLRAVCDELESYIVLEEVYDERENREARKALNRGLKMLGNEP
jgi:hypothetical protein